MPDCLGDLLVDDELGHGVWNLLEQDGTETAVESTDTFSSRDLAEATNQTGGEGGLGDQSNTGGLERAEGDVGEEFGEGGGGKVDGRSVVGGGLYSEEVDGLCLEEFITSELEGTLQEVTCEGRTNAGQESTSTLICDDLSETTDETTVVCDGIELDSGLDAGSRSAHVRLDRSETYTSTGVRAPWVTEQHTAPAKACDCQRIVGHLCAGGLTNLL